MLRQWSVWQMNAGYCSLFLRKLSFVFWNVVTHQAQNARKINSVSGHHMQGPMRTSIALRQSLFYRASTFCKFTACSALETPKLKNASASLKVPAQPHKGYRILVGRPVYSTWVNPSHTSATIGRPVFRTSSRCGATHFWSRYSSQMTRVQRLALLVGVPIGH